MMQPPREILGERYQYERVAEGSGKIASSLARRVGRGWHCPPDKLAIKLSNIEVL
jgi:hypothetical protein